jgi:hypothetical protein
VIFRKKSSSGDSVLASQKPPESDFERSELGLSLTVAYTTVEATLAALRYAGELAIQLEAQIRILMIQAVPYSLPIDRPQVDPAFRIRQFLTRSEKESIETRIDVWLCRDVGKCLLQALQPQSLILIGIHRRLWFTREKRWGRTLKRAGHHVIFVHGDKRKVKTPG